MSESNPGNPDGAAPRPKSAPMPSKSVKKIDGAMTTCVLAGSSAITGDDNSTESATLIASEFASELPFCATYRLFGLIQSTRLPTRLNVTRNGSYTRPAKAPEPTPDASDGEMMYVLPKLSGARSKYRSSSLRMILMTPASCVAPRTNVA